MAGNDPTSKMLSYAAIKEILAEMSFETREKIQRQIPSLQTPNSAVPYKYDFVYLVEHGIVQLNNSQWEHRYREWEDSNRIRFHDERDHFDEDGNRRIKYEYSQEVEERVPLQYIRDGTRIQHLQLTGLPRSIKQQNPDNYKIHVSELTLGGRDSFFRGDTIQELFRSLAPFLKHPLKKLTFQITPQTLSMLSDPLIKDCAELSLGRHFNHTPLTVEDLLRHNKMDQTHLEVAFMYRPPRNEEPNSGLNFVRDLVQHWIDIEKSIGSTFTSPTDKYFFICDVFDELKTTFNARKSKIEELGTDFFAHCYIIPLNETSEIVAYAIKESREYMILKSEYALKIEVRPIGSTEAEKFFK